MPSNRKGGAEKSTWYHAAAQLAKFENSRRCNSLFQCFTRECGQNKACFVNLLVVVAAQFLLLLGAPSSHWRLDISIGIFAANHEPDLARRICGNGGVGILSDREDFLAFFLELGNEWQVEPLILG